MSRRIFWIVTTTVIGSMLLLACLFGFAVYSFWCPVTVTATRDHIPTIMAPPETTGQPIRRLTLSELRLQVQELESDSVTLTTFLSVADVFAFYEQQLVAEGWDPKIGINQQTNQMFVINKQACPFYALEIRLRSLSPTETQIFIDPYWPQSEACGDCN